MRDGYIEIPRKGYATIWWGNIGFDIDLSCDKEFLIKAYKIHLLKNHPGFDILDREDFAKHMIESAFKRYKENYKEN